MRSLLLLTLAMALMPAATNFAQAQDNPSVYATTYIDVAPASKGQAVAALKQLAEASRKDAGVLTFLVLQRTEPSHQFVIHSAWKDQAALDAHMATAHSKQAVAALAAIQIAPADTRLCTNMVPTTYQAPPAGAIFGVSHVDVAPPKRDDAVTALVKYAEATRKAQGNLAYYPVREKQRLNHFTVVEIWRDQAAADAHETDAASKDFRTTLSAITGALYDRRWYKAL
jgi:quinol monooxygenase YgiN